MSHYFYFINFKNKLTNIHDWDWVWFICNWIKLNNSNWGNSIKCWNYLRNQRLVDLPVGMTESLRSDDTRLAAGTSVRPCVWVKFSSGRRRMRMFWETRRSSACADKSRWWKCWSGCGIVGSAQKNGAGWSWRSAKIPHRIEADRSSRWWSSRPSGAEDHVTCEWRERWAGYCDASSAESVRNHWNLGRSWKRIRCGWPAAACSSDVWPWPHRPQRTE